MKYDRDQVAAGIQHHAEHAEQIHAADTAGVAQQPPVDAARLLRRLRALAATAGRSVVQGDAAPGSLTVATFICVKPSRPSTSIAVTTDWWLARPSARIVTGAACAPRRGALEDRRAQRIGARN